MREQVDYGIRCRVRSCSLIMKALLLSLCPSVTYRTAAVLSVRLTLMRCGPVHLFVFVISCIKQLFIPKKEAPFTRLYTIPAPTYPVQTTKPSSWVDLCIPWRCFSCIKPPPLTSVKLAHRLALVLLSKHKLKYDRSFSLPFPLHLTFASAAPELYLSQIKTKLLYF